MRFRTSLPPEVTPHVERSFNLGICGKPAHSTGSVVVYKLCSQRLVVVVVWSSSFSSLRGYCQYRWQLAMTASPSGCASGKIIHCNSFLGCGVKLPSWRFLHGDLTRTVRSIGTECMRYHRSTDEGAGFTSCTAAPKPHFAISVSQVKGLPLSVRPWFPWELAHGPGGCPRTVQA